MVLLEEGNWCLTRFILKLVLKERLIKRRVAAVSFRCGKMTKLDSHLMARLIDDLVQPKRAKTDDDKVAKLVSYSEWFDARRDELNPRARESKQHVGRCMTMQVHELR